MREFMKTITWLKCSLEYLGGSREGPPPRELWAEGEEGRGSSEGRRFIASFARGLWWALLAAAIILFCGQTSKFIYIDF